MNNLLKTITINLTTDFECPWCYVGEMRLKKALNEYKQTNPNIQINILINPYMIDPGTNEKGEEYMAYNERRWGSDGWTYSMKKSALKDGCEFKNWKWWPNTLNAHQLLVFSEKENKQMQVMETIFHRLYEEGLNISSKQEVLDVAKQIGISNDFTNFLGSKEAIDEVKKKDRRAKQQGIGGVPYFVIGNGQQNYTLEGAQDSKTFIEVFNELTK